MGQYSEGSLPWVSHLWIAATLAPMLPNGTLLHLTLIATGGNASVVKLPPG